MDMERIERAITSAARIYREINKPVLRSKIDMTHEIYESEDADEPALTIDVKGKPSVKLLDLVMWGSALMIFLSIVAKILGIFRRK